MTPALSLESLSDDTLFRHVSDALKQYHSVLLLARSPLADSQLVVPALVRDDLSPTAQERGRALRLVLRWAVRQLEPTSARHALGEPRPLDDPTWQDPAWWRYNILRHRYLEPLHPDDFVDGGRYTETLLALTGIPSRDLYYEERSRAIREVAQWLRAQAAGGDASQTLRRLALEEVYEAIREDEAAVRLLTAAATFNDVIPQALLASLTRNEGLPEPVVVINRLVAARYLLAGDGDTLWLSPVLRRFLYQRDEPDRRRLRHARIGEFYRVQGDTLRAVFHLQQARHDSAAATLLLQDARDLLYEADGDELTAALGRFDRNALTPSQWYQLQSLLGDLRRLMGEEEHALEAYRRALQAASTDQEQAHVYRRLGKLYEQRSQRQALHYYDQAATRFTQTPRDPEFVEMLKDRAWVQIERGEFAAAHSDLEQAQTLAPDTSPAIQANIHDALASLYYYENDADAALRHMRAALSLREESGDLLGVAKSQNNLGLLFSAVDDHAGAVAVYKEALAGYQQLGNRELAAATLLNLGMAHHLMEERDHAITYYREALELCRARNWHVTAARAHSNLAEAYAETGRIAQGRDEWQRGIELARDAGLDEEVAYFIQLLEQFPALRHDAAVAGEPSAQGAGAGETDAETGSTQVQDFDTEQAIRLARVHGRVTTRAFMDAAGVSKATATRKLSALADAAVLVKVGQGRATHYVLPSADRADALAAPQDARAVLANQRILLEHYYGITALGLPADVGDELVVVVRFAELPDLLTFFALEERLAQTLGRPLRLRPEAALTPETHGHMLAQVDWIWSI